jgi:hypothetical protein
MIEYATANRSQLPEDKVQWLRRQLAYVARDSSSRACILQHIAETEAAIERRRLPTPPAPPAPRSAAPTMNKNDWLWLRRSWVAMNDDLFGGKLSEPLLQITDLTKYQAQGAHLVCNNGERAIAIEQKLLTGQSPSVRDLDAQGRSRYILDVLLHEMAHQATENDCDDHGPAFVRECQRLTDLLRGFKKSTSVSLDNCRRWPMSCRKVGYYNPGQKLAAQLTRINIIVRACEMEMAMLDL